MLKIFVRHENREDIPAIGKVNEAAFDTGAEARLVDALRDGGVISLSLVALINHGIVGHILFSPVVIESESSSLAALGLGPMAVLPAYQRKGIGSELVKVGLEKCLALGLSAVVVLGHPDFYPRFGFVPSTQYSIISEYDVPAEVFMVKELRQGALAGQTGIAKYHHLFHQL